VKQVYALLDVIVEVTVADWETKRDEIKADHNLERACKDLNDGWKAWLVENGPNRKGKASRMARPANGIGSVVPRRQ
jgi:hypothetical protein